MFDQYLRIIKEGLLQGAAHRLLACAHPTTITHVAFAVGLCGILAAVRGHFSIALVLWILNRILDGMDGIMARISNQQTDYGGLLDITYDFTIFSLVPLAIEYRLLCSESSAQLPLTRMTIVALLEIAFHVNNAVLFLLGSLLSKKGADTVRLPGHLMTIELTMQKTKHKRLTSAEMPSALIEGTESGILFTLMFAFPERTSLLCVLMTFGVCLNIVQRVLWARNLEKESAQ